MNVSIRRTVLTLFCLSALLIGAPAFSQDEALPSVEEVVASHLESSGGADAWRSVKTLEMSGTLVLPQGMEAAFSMRLKRPHKMRMEFSIQGMTGIQAYDGDIGWQIMPFQGKTDAEEMPSEQLEQAREQAEIDPALLDWEKRGYQVEVIGRDEVEGAGVIKLKVTKDNGKEEIHYLDDEYFLLIKQTGENEMMGNVVAYESSLSDFKEVDGLMMAHTIVQGMAGGPASTTIHFEKITLNPDISDDIFVMPEPAPAPAAEEGSEEAGGGK